MESSDADELVCPPPPVISKVAISFGKPQAPKVKPFDTEFHFKI